MVWVRYRSVSGLWLVGGRQVDCVGEVSALPGVGERAHPVETTRALAVRAQRHYAQYEVCTDKEIVRQSLYF